MDGRRDDANNGQGGKFCRLLAPLFPASLPSSLPPIVFTHRLACTISRPPALGPSVGHPSILVICSPNIRIIRRHAIRARPI